MPLYESNLSLQTKTLNKFTLTKKFVIMSKSCIVHTLRVFADFVLFFGFLETVKTLNNLRNKFVLIKKFVIMSKSCIVHALRVFADFVLLFRFLERMTCFPRLAVQYQSQDSIYSNSDLDS